jgi:hypothetical protein
MFFAVYEDAQRFARSRGMRVVRHARMRNGRWQRGYLVLRAFN